MPIPGGDKYSSKSEEVNKYLENICKAKNSAFVSNESMNASRHLNNSKLHLNINGDAILAGNFRSMISKY